MLRKTTLLGFALASVSFAMILSMSGCGEKEEKAPAAVTLEGWALYEAENYEGAKEKFEEALTIGPGYVDAYVGLGWAHGKMANLQECIDNFQSALSQEPQNVDALAGVALAYLADDRYDQVIASSERALEIDPDYLFEPTGITAQDLKIALAESYYYKGAFEEVKRILDITEEVSPAELLEELEAASGG